MSYAWQTVEQAAVTLGCSTRTINRRIKDNQIQSRLEAGRREVLVCLPEGLKEPTPPPSPISTVSDKVSSVRIDVSQIEADAAQRVAEATDAAAHSVEDVSDAPAAASAEMLALTEERVRRAEMAVVAFRQTATLYQSEVARARFGARFAWAIVALLGLGTYVVVGWTTSQVSQSRTQAENALERVRSASDTADKQARETEKLHEQITEAKLAQARAEGELSAMRGAEKAEQASDRQDPKSVGQTNVLQKLANLWVTE
jgi:hypothetical protein